MRRIFTVEVTHDVRTSRALATRESLGTHEGRLQGMGDILLLDAVSQDCASLRKA